MNFRAYFVCAATVALSIGTLAPCRADVMLEASLFTTIAPVGTTTPIVLSGITTPSQSVISGTGYTVSFVNMPSNQGVVSGSVVSAYAVPVAGETAGAAEYLTGDYDSALTTNIAASGNYLSTAATPSAIVITFATPQDAFALLWGSIDASNLITVNDATSDSVSGTEVQQVVSGFVSNGFQGPGGSAYVEFSTSTDFTTVTLSSGVVSFESAGLVASTDSFVPVPAPEPSSIALFGGGVFGLAIARRRWLPSYPKL